MQEHVTQAKHNHKFHDGVHECFEDNYFDWKITALFYTALHYIRAFIKSKNINPGTSHEDIDNQINPKKANSPIPVSVTCWENYRNLYHYSRAARYDGFIDIDKFNSDKKIDHIYSGQHLEDIMKYLRSHGMKI